MFLKKTLALKWTLRFKVMLNTHDKHQVTCSYLETDYMKGRSVCVIIIKLVY